MIETDEEIEGLSIDEEDQQKVSGGTLKALVIKLTSHQRPDVQYLKVFLMTYRTFTNSIQLLELLIDRYHIQPPSNLNSTELKLWFTQKQQVIKIRVTNVIRTWIESHLSNEEAEYILPRVSQFATREMVDLSLSKKVTLSCEKRKIRGHLPHLMIANPPGEPPLVILPRNKFQLDLLEIDPLELARQLTLLESNLFRQIAVPECLARVWENKELDSSNLTKLINMNNSVTHWVGKTILFQNQKKKRANIIKHFISTAERCHQLKNYSTLIQIVAGLTMTPVFRLRRTWETISQKNLSVLNSLGQLMSPTKNYITYREMIKKVSPPCVPFIGVYLTDLTFIGDGNLDQLRERPDEINFDKRRKSAEVMIEMQSFQSMPYHLISVSSIANYLDACFQNLPNEKDLYSISLGIEPKEKEDEKVSRLLVESGFI
ncbi:ras guanine nucleotide exchange factor domain-containing protein [Melampsora americana]|nr:ras guanine nucleotide exchange factor domain-containing protein [Melampsora americana]